MKKLHVDGFLESFDFWSNDACEIFLEIIKTPLIGQRERMTSLLELVHIVVWSPLCVVKSDGFQLHMLSPKIWVNIWIFT